MQDIRKHFLFFPFEFDPLQYLDSKEFGSEKCDIFIVTSSSSVIWPSGQSIRLSHGLSRIVVESKVEVSEI